MTIKLHFDADLCIGCDSCGLIFPGITAYADETGLIEIDAIGPVFLQDNTNATH